MRKRRSSTFYLRDPSEPFEIAAGPAINQPDQKQSDEEEKLGEYEATSSRKHRVFENYGAGEDGCDLHVENDEDDGNDVKSDVELDPGTSGRGFPALIGNGVAPAISLFGTNELTDEKHRRNRQRGDGKEPECGDKARLQGCPSK